MLKMGKGKLKKKLTNESPSKEIQSIRKVSEEIKKDITIDIKVDNINSVFKEKRFNPNKNKEDIKQNFALDNFANVLMLTKSKMNKHRDNQEKKEKQ